MYEVSEITNAAESYNIYYIGYATRKSEPFSWEKRSQGLRCVILRMYKILSDIRINIIHVYKHQWQICRKLKGYTGAIRLL